MIFFDTKNLNFPCSLNRPEFPNMFLRLAKLIDTVSERVFCLRSTLVVKIKKKQGIILLKRITSFYYRPIHAPRPPLWISPHTNDHSKNSLTTPPTPTSSTSLHTPSSTTSNTLVDDKSYYRWGNKPAPPFYLEHLGFGPLPFCE